MPEFVKSYGFPGGSIGTESPAIQETTCNAGLEGSIPRSGRFPREENENPLQDSCLGNPINRGAWRATVHRVAESLTGLKGKPPPPAFL